jgi:hypothetical protein
MYPSTEDSEAALAFERNDAGPKRLSSCISTDKWLTCLPFEVRIHL